MDRRICNAKVTLTFNTN